MRPAKGERAAQRTGYRPGQVMQVDWAEMPTRPRLWGRERRVYALICSLPYVREILCQNGRLAGNVLAHRDTCARSNSRR